MGQFSVKIYGATGSVLNENQHAVSTRIKVAGEGEWHARKHGGPKRRVWTEIHLGVDEETLEVRAVTRSQGATSAMHGFYPTSSTRSRRTSRSAVSWLTVPTTHGNATTQLLTVVPTPLSRHARTQSHGRPSPPEPWRETRPCARRSAWLARSGDDGADTTAEAVSRRK
ncbi:hypothetical protein DSM14862_04299 (plasmid) [Sulfitobacter indolifex]|nr:hypothetical protein DSM14862_04299 [Sulfitobacter indolifex]